MVRFAPIAAALALIGLLAGFTFGQQTPTPAGEAGSQLNAPQQLDGLDGKVIKKIARDDHLTLGNGVSLDRIAHGKPPALIIDPVKDIVQKPNYGTNIDLRIATTRKHLEDLFGVNVEAKVQALFASGGVTFNDERESSVSEESFQLVIVGNHDYGDREFLAKEFKLRPEAQALISAGRMAEFERIYGSHFITSEHRVGKIIVTIGADKWSDKTREQLRLAAEVNGGFIVTGSLKTAIQNDLKQAKNRNSLSISASLVGGEGLADFEEIVKASLSNTIGNSETFELDIAVARLLRGFIGWENSGISSVAVQSYVPYGFNPNGIPLWNQSYEDKLSRCAEKCRAAQSVIQRIRQALESASPPLRADSERVFKLANRMNIATTPRLGFSGQERRSRSDEHGVSQRHYGQTMEGSARTAAAPADHRSAPLGSPASVERHPVCRANRLSVAAVAQGFSRVEERLYGLLAVAKDGRLAAGS